MEASKNGKKKSENHHWWPECVSQHWKNSGGRVHWLKPNGEVIEAPPNQFGRIGNGHYIKLGKNGEATVWDQNFEPIFDNADNNFPGVITWLRSLNRIDLTHEKILTARYLPEKATDDQIAKLAECIISLAIRSPVNREAAVSVAERLRGPLCKRERNALIALNMRDSHKQAVSSIGTAGKFAVFYSPSREFIFGDGFFHNITSPVQHYLYNAKLFVPITPDISVLYVRPRMYSTEPRLSTFVVDADEAELLNSVIQIYSRKFLFFRNEQPEILPDYACEMHKQFLNSHNPADYLISTIRESKNPEIIEIRIYLRTATVNQFS